MFRKLLPSLFIVILVVGMSAPVSASGLLVFENGVAKTLVPLSGLSVVADMNDVQATVDETRTYEWSPFAVSEITELRFVRSFTTTSGVVSQAAVNGVPISGKLYLGDESVQLRRQWASQSGESAVLRALSGALWVSDPLDVDSTLEWFGQLQIQIVSEELLSVHGTLRGVSVPTDWHPQPVQWVQVEVAAQTELPTRTLFAPYHTLNTARIDTHHLSGTYSGTSRCTSFDVTLLMSSGTDPVHLDLIAHRYHDSDGGHFMAMISPDPNPASTQVVPRDLALVMDISGSMGGEKMAAAKASLKAVLAGLQPQDSFSLIAFDDQIDSFSPEAVLATPANIEMAIGFVEKQKPDGSTNIHDALKTALLQLPTPSDHPRYVVLLTDGMPTAGETDVDAILAMAEAYNEVNARIFTFGIGADVNTILLDKLAAQSNGDALYVLSAQGISTMVTSFFAQITSPLLADPILTIDNITTSHLYPEVLPDLFADQTFVLFGRYDEGGEAVLTLSGQVSGKTVVHSFQIVLPTFQMAEGFVPRVWAKRHVGTLLQEVKLGSSDPSLVAEVTEIARRYGVVTEFTYFELNELGDAMMTYSAVPNAAVGEDAVSTSSSLDSYQKGGGVEGDSDSFVRYAFDRTFPRQSGYFSDTSVEGAGGLVDLHFGSQAYWDLLQSEADMGIGDFFAIAPNVVFEFLGRTFRVSIPAETAPPETAIVPGPQSGMTVPDHAVVVNSKVYVEVTDGGHVDPDAPIVTPEINAPGAVNPTDGISVGDSEAAEPLSMGCATTSDAIPAWWKALVVFMGVLLIAARRQHRRRG